MLLSPSYDVTGVVIDYLLTEYWCSTVYFMLYKCTCFWWSNITFGIIAYYK